ncbi:MAG: hypothetical protein K0S40_113 [Actinomycetospora sp.]|nr:hypothetical protein [Actinomycetospora sp.]
MPFAAVTQVPTGTLATYRRVLADAVGHDRPEGLIMHLAGESEDGLQIVSVWESGVHHDRFVAERLHPALRRVGVPADTGMRHVEFDADDLGTTSALAPSRP